MLAIGLLIMFNELFQRLSVGESLSDLLAEFDVAVMDGIEDDELHFFNVGTAIFSQVGFVNKAITDFGSAVLAFGRLAEFLLDAAFQGHGEVGEDRGVHLFSLYGGPAGFLHLLCVVLGRNDAYEVGGYQGLPRGEGYGEFAVAVEVDGRGV